MDMFKKIFTWISMKDLYPKVKKSKYANLRNLFMTISKQLKFGISYLIKTIKKFGFVRNSYKTCVHKSMQGNAIIFLVLYVGNIIFIGNDIGVLSTIKLRLSIELSIGELGEASYVLGVKSFIKIGLIDC